MTSRELARALLRVTGLAFLATIASGNLGYSLLRSMFTWHNAGQTVTVLSIVVPMTIGGLLFVFRGGTIADRFRLGVDARSSLGASAPSSGMTSSSVFAVGAAVLGVFVLIDAIDPLSHLLATTFVSAPNRRGMEIGDFVIGAAPTDRSALLTKAGLSIAAALALLLGPGRVWRFREGSPPSAQSTGAPRSMSSRELAKLLLRLLGIILVFVCAIELCMMVGQCVHHGLAVWDDLLRTELVESLLIGIAGAFLARQAGWIASRLSIGRFATSVADSDAASPIQATAEPVVWTPTAARRVGYVLVGVLALVHAVHPVSALVRALLGLGERNFSPLSDIGPRRDLASNAILAGAYASAGIVLIVSPGKIGRWLRDTFTLPRSAGDPIQS